MRDLKGTLKDMLESKFAEQNELFEKLPPEKRSDINKYVSYSTKVRFHYFSKDSAKEGDYIPPIDDEIEVYAEYCDKLQKSLSRKELCMALIQHHYIFYKFMMSFESQLNENELNEEEKLLVTEGIFECALNAFGDIEKITGELLGYKTPVDARKQQTSTKWQPYQDKYDELVLGGMKSSTAIGRISVIIALAIKEHPETTPFTKSPNRTTLYRQLVTNRK